MHTLRPSKTGDNLYDVVFSSNKYGHLNIQKSLPLHEAMQLVNYLNGGSGYLFVPKDPKGSYKIG